MVFTSIGMGLTCGFLPEFWASLASALGGAAYWTFMYFQIFVSSEVKTALRHQNTYRRAWLSALVVNVHLTVLGTIATQAVRRLLSHH